MKKHQQRLTSVPHRSVLTRDVNEFKSFPSVFVLFWFFAPALLHLKSHFTAQWTTKQHVRPPSSVSFTGGQKSFLDHLPVISGCVSFIPPPLPNFKARRYAGFKQPSPSANQTPLQRTTIKVQKMLIRLKPASTK